MTDGNHGKAVASISKKYGYNSIIFVPSNIELSQVKSIEELGATIIFSDTYDDAVRSARQSATANDWFLISDTSWEDYIEIPKDIVAGYGTIFREIERQIQYDSQLTSITHVIIQAGVGGLASAAAAWLTMDRGTACWVKDVTLLIVEPTDADCLFANIVHQNKMGCCHTQLIASSGKTNSIMTGLNCGIPSLISWPIIRDVASYFITIGDKWPVIAMQQLSEQGISSGESGAAGLAALLAMNHTAHDIFDKDSVVLLINTESGP